MLAFKAAMPSSAATIWPSSRAFQRVSQKARPSPEGAHRGTMLAESTQTTSIFLETFIIPRIRPAPALGQALFAGRGGPIAIEEDPPYYMICGKEIA
jgi:hypothetical protein